MEVIEEEQTKQQKEMQIKNKENKQIFEQKPAEQPEQAQKQKKKSQGIKLTPEMEKAVDEKVEQIMGNQIKEENKES